MREPRRFGYLMIHVTLVQDENFRALIVRKETSTYVFRYEATVRNAIRLQGILLQYARRDDLDFAWEDIEAIVVHLKIISQGV